MPTDQVNNPAPVGLNQKERTMENSHSDYITQQAKLALTLHDLLMRAASEEDWSTYHVLSQHVAERSSTALLTLAREIAPPPEDES